MSDIKQIGQLYGTELKVKSNADNEEGLYLNPEDVEIRRLTPQECFRLQGFPDEYFKRAKQFNSDSQLYKQAGNSVTVNVIEAIAERFNCVYGVGV